MHFLSGVRTAAACAIAIAVIFAVAVCHGQSTTPMPTVTGTGAHNTSLPASGDRATKSGVSPVTETVYVADPANQEIFEFANGNKTAIATSFSGATGSVTGIARHSTGFIFALDAAGTQSIVKIFDAQLGLAGEIPSQDLPLQNPVGIAMDSKDDVFVGDNLSSSLVVYKLPAVSASGTPSGAKVTFKLPATLPSGSHISGVSVNSTGKYLYVLTNTWDGSGTSSTAWQSDVSIFTLHPAALVTSFNASYPFNPDGGGADGVGIAGDASGNSYIAYSSIDVVSTGLLQVWGLNGTMTTTLGTPDLSTMNAVALDSTGEVISINGYLLGENFGTNTPPTIARQTTAGTSYQALATNGTKNPSGIVAAPKLNSTGLRLYAADNSIATATGYQGPLSDSTTAAYTFDLPNILNGEFGNQTAYGIAIDPTDPNGTIYVANTDTVNRVTEIDAFARPTANGSYSPIERISSGLLTYEGQIAFDQDGDLFIPGLEEISPTAEVVERIHGSGFANSYQPIIVSGLSFPQCVAIDTAGNLYVLDQVYTGTSYEDNFYEYTPTDGQYSQTPSHTLTNLYFGASCSYDALLNEVFVTEETKVVGYNSALAVKRTIEPTLSSGTYLNGLGFDSAGTLYLGTSKNEIEVIPQANFGTGTPTVTFNSTGAGYPSVVAQIVIGD
jgi:hypothetical protein